MSPYFVSPQSSTKLIFYYNLLFNRVGKSSCEMLWKTGIKTLISGRLILFCSGINESLHVQKVLLPQDLIFWVLQRTAPKSEEAVKIQH